MMVAAFFWLVTAVATFKIGVQPLRLWRIKTKRPAVFRLLETQYHQSFQFARGAPCHADEKKGGFKSENIPLAGVGLHLKRTPAE
jgi:hypothetical protein